MAQATIGLVLDCADPEALGRFWEQALGLQRFGAAGAYVLLASPSGALPKFFLQRVGEAKLAKNRMHLDIETSDVDAEVERLAAVGRGCALANVYLPGMTRRAGCSRGLSRAADTLRSPCWQRTWSCCVTGHVASRAEN